jgi:hypothetical protein
MNNPGMNKQVVEENFSQESSAIIQEQRVSARQVHLSPIVEESTSPVRELSLVKKFYGMNFSSPTSPKQNRVEAAPKFGLTPIMEDLRELRLTSTAKKCKDDFEILASSRRQAAPTQEGLTLNDELIAR